MPDALAELADRAERLLGRAAVRTWEICASEERSVELEAVDGHVDAASSASERALGVRVLDGGIGFAGLTEASDEAIAGAIEGAIAEARHVRPARSRGFAGPAARPAGAPFLDPRATGRPRPALVEGTLALEAAALQVSPTIARVRPAAIAESAGRVLIRTSGGLAVEERFSRASAMLVAVAEDDEGEAHAVSAVATAPCFEALDLEHVARRAASRAALRLGARGFRTDRVPVLLDAEVVADLIGIVADALAGDRVERGATFLAGALGTPILGQAITIWDRPHDPDLDGASWWDGEGLATEARLLIERGVPKTWLHDLESAARAGAPPNAQAVRAGAASKPRPGAHALALDPGTEEDAALLAAAEGGIYVSELSGLHTINEITGALSVGASGWAVRGGAWAEPLEGVMIAGRLTELLGGAVRVAKRSEVHGGARASAILLPEVQVASREDEDVEEFH